MDPNSNEALRLRLNAGALTWDAPTVMLIARAAFAVAAQGLGASVFLLRSSPTPWHDAEPWLPVYGTLIDAGCLALLWRLTRRATQPVGFCMGRSRRRSSSDYDERGSLE